MSKNVSLSHEQVTVNGVAVDAGISDLLAYLWPQAVRTVYSCQGEDSASAFSGYIAFADAASFDAARPLLLGLAREAGLLSVFGKSHIVPTSPIITNVQPPDVVGEWTVLKRHSTHCYRFAVYIHFSEVAALNRMAARRLAQDLPTVSVASVMS